MIQGHPWDLYGLSRIFDGSDALHTLVTAQKPEGRPTFDTTSQDAINRFRALGYDINANVTTDELLWEEPFDLRDARPLVENIIERINGIAMTLDVYFRPVKPIHVVYPRANGAGASPLGDWTPNRDSTLLDRLRDSPCRHCVATA